MGKDQEVGHLSNGGVGRGRGVLGGVRSSGFNES